MCTPSHEDRGRPRKRPRKRGLPGVKPLPEAKALAQIRKQIWAMTREQWLQSFVDAGIFTPTFRLTAQMRRLDKEGYVYGPRGERPPSLPLFKELSKQLQKERARKSHPRRDLKATRRA
jgi:hypothetical protein